MFFIDCFVQSVIKNLMNCAIRALPSPFCLRGRLCTPFTGISRAQTGFLVGCFVFTPTRTVASKTFKETNHTDAFLL